MEGFTEEKNFEVEVNGQYRNIKLNKIPKGKFIVVEKNFVEGKLFEGKYGKSYICSVSYNGESGSFFLNEKYHNQYKAIGGQGDHIRIGRDDEVIDNAKTGVKMIVPKYFFEKVE